jgi:hypothetical protein
LASRRGGHSERRHFDGACRSIASQQHRDRAGLDREHHHRPAGDDDAERDREGGQRDRLREEHADHGGDGLCQVVETQQLQRIPADDERDEDEAADDRDCHQGLEQRVGDELDEHNLPIRGRDEGAAFEGELQQSSHSTMTVRMTFPSFVTRAATRIAFGGVVMAAAIAVAALVIERTALGGDLAASRARAPGRGGR